MQNIYETNANPHINNFKHRYEEDQRMAALGYVREQPGPRNANNNNNNSNKNNLITNELESKFKQFNVVSKRSDSLERANKGTSSSSSSSKFVYAHAAFESDVPGDLTFAEGVCIEVLEEVDANWWKGRIGSRIGIFPKTFVKK